MKNSTFVILLIAGMVLVIAGALMKIAQLSSGNYIMLFGMLLEFGALGTYLFHAFTRKKP